MKNPSKHLLVCGVIKEWVIALRWFADAHRSLLLNALEVNLIRIEESIRRINHIKITASLLLERLLGQKAEITRHSATVCTWCLLDWNLLQHRVLSRALIQV